MHGLKPDDRLILLTEQEIRNHEFKRDFDMGPRTKLHDGAYVVVSVTESRVRLADTGNGYTSSKWFHEVSTDEAMKLVPFKRQ